MNNFPTIVMDNFYNDPDFVRDFALSLEYEQSDGTFAGKRTKPLNLIDVDFYKESVSKFLSLFYDLSFVSCSNVNVLTQFTLIDSFAPEKDSIKNKPWVHRDEGTILAGVVYLSKEADSNSGTTVYKSKPNLNTQATLSDTSHRVELFGNTNVDDVSVEYKNQITNHNSLFEESVIIKNEYNRIVCYDSYNWHCASSHYSSSEPRLTQTFFLLNINCNTKYPITRVKNFKL
jgi:hypothetical protein